MRVVSVKADLRSKFGPARDQGRRPTCVAFATSDAHAAMRSEPNALSAEYAFYQGQRRTGGSPFQGAHLSAVLAGINEHGQPNERDWPYLTEVLDAASWSPPPVSELFRRASDIEVPAMGTAISHLDRGTPSVALLYLSRSFYVTPADGIVDQVPGEPPDTARRHAVVVVAHGLVDESRAVLVRNSWGSKWGIDGHCWLTETFLQPRLYGLAIFKEDQGVSRNSPSA